MLDQESVYNTKSDGKKRKTLAVTQPSAFAVTAIGLYINTLF